MTQSKEGDLYIIAVNCYEGIPGLLKNTIVKYLKPHRLDNDYCTVRTLTTQYPRYSIPQSFIKRCTSEDLDKYYNKLLEL